MGPNRRHVLLGIAAGLAGPARAHTPYGQWVVYRQKHLLVGAHRGDPVTYDLARSLVAALDAELPEARARVARGPRPQRIASLMNTGQLLLAVIGGAEAGRMAAADPPFDGFEPVPLRSIAALSESHHLYATPELPDDHAFLVAGTLDHAGLGRAPEPGGLPLHAGAAPVWTVAD